MLFKAFIISALFITSVQATMYDGRIAIVTNNDEAYEYEIIAKQDGIITLLENGADMEEHSPEKIFSYTIGDRERLVVWFSKPADTFWGHTAGIYLYKASNINSWDHLLFFDGIDKRPRLDSRVVDMIKYQGQIMILRVLEADPLIGDNRRFGYIQYLDGTLVSPDGALNSQTLDFTPDRFFQDLDGSLYIIGFDEKSKKYREYLFRGREEKPRVTSEL